MSDFINEPKEVLIGVDKSGMGEVEVRKGDRRELRLICKKKNKILDKTMEKRHVPQPPKLNLVF